MHRRSLTLALLSCFGAHAAAQDLTTERIATGFDEPLFAGAPAGDFGRLFIVEQRGRIEILDITNDTQVGTFLDLSAIVNDSGNERGLLGLAFHPDYMTNGRFFVSYTAEVDGSSHLIKYSAIPPTSNVANPTPVQTIYTLPQPFQNHNGGCIQFAPDGKLYLSIGDGGVDIEATVAISGKTGVEMEALTAASVAALTVYDMVKAVDKAMVIESVVLESKSGGRSGHYIRGSE